ncbi:MAG TPA: DUF559 domain-containing protein [Candidatus Pacearchaeota archaeon]|nr:DUF559 domain-containing protein [Candidatus Pacearchaeota archaeon]
MPTGVYKRTEETKKRMSISQKGHSGLYGEKNPMFGKHHSEKTRQKMSEASKPRNGEKNPFFGKKHSEETKKKISESNKGEHHSVRTEFKKGLVSWNKGKKLSKEQKSRLNLSGLEKGWGWNKGVCRSDEVKQKISSKLKKYKITDSHRKNLSNSLKGRIFSKEWLQKNREWQINNPNRKFKDTGIELKIEEELKKRRIIYQKQIPLCKTAIVDFYLPQNNIVIQADGCYWHNCPIHHPDHYLGARERDFKKDIVLTKNGFKVYRFWEHEINESVKECVNKVFK